MNDQGQFHKMSPGAAQNHSHQGKGDRATSQQICTARMSRPWAQGGVGRDFKEEKQMLLESDKSLKSLKGLWEILGRAEAVG